MTKENHIISPEGYPILLFSFLLSFALAWLHIIPGLIGLSWCLFCIYFFRNPGRKQLEQEGVIIAPADGTIVRIEETEEKNFLNKKMTMVSIFMSPFNVHVNRMPVTAVVKDVAYKKGRFKAAFAQDAPEKNERCAVLTETKDKNSLVFVQVAGWFARRIINYLKKGEELEQGCIFGVIKFGSRVDLYLPEDYVVEVGLKQKVKAGMTVLANKK